MQGLLLGVGGKQLQRIKQESNSRVEVVNSHGNLNGSHPDPIDETLHALVTADNMVGAVLRWAGRSWAMLDWAALGHAGLGLGRAVLFLGIGMVVALGRAVLGWSWLGRAGLVSTLPCPGDAMCCHAVSKQLVLGCAVLVCSMGGYPPTSAAQGQSCDCDMHAAPGLPPALSSVLTACKLLLQVKLQRAVDLVVQVLSPTNASFESFQVEAGGSTRLLVTQPSRGKAAASKAKVCVQLQMSLQVASAQSVSMARSSCLVGADADMHAAALGT